MRTGTDLRGRFVIDWKLCQTGEASYCDGAFSMVDSAEGRRSIGIAPRDVEAVLGYAAKLCLERLRTG